MMEKHIVTDRNVEWSRAGEYSTISGYQQV